LIVLSPVIVLAAAVFWAVRVFRRREERRLLSAA
jgi:protein-S-isoprenylcysteine O-methyltransferase Ste14